MSNIVFNEAKFKELLVYIAQECQDDIFFGATKLNKQLFFIDFLAYEKFGKPITGAEYIALERGPVPKRLLPIRATMIEDGDILREFRGHQDRIVAARLPDMTAFSVQEMELIDFVIETLRDTRADEVSDLSHRFPGWQAAIAEGQVTKRHVVIPYDAVFVWKPTLTEQEQIDTLERARRHEWPV